MNKMISLILIIFIPLTLLGCWDVQDVADTAFITAIGLDASKDPNMIKVTFVMPKPSIIRVRSDQIFSVEETVEAESISRAIERIETRLSRKVRLGHLRIIVIGEKLSEKNLRGFTNFFEKNPEVALRTRITFVQGGDANELFNVSPILDRSKVSELVGLLMTAKANALGKPVTLQELRKGLLRSNGTALSSRVLINKSNEPFVEHEGGTVLKDWRVIGWLNEKDIKENNWFSDTGKPKITGKIGSSQYTFSIVKKSLKIIPKTDGGKLHFLVKGKISGTVIEEQFGIDLSDPKNIKKLEDLLSTIVTNQIKSAVNKSQKHFKVDYLGFGKALEIKNSQMYKTIDWPQVYPDVPVTVTVKTNVHRFGKTK